MTKKQLPVRKQNRIKDFDYSSVGAYFITMCVKDKKCLLWKAGYKYTEAAPDIELSKYGMAVEQAIKSIPVHYPLVAVDKYVIMPNHIHLILSIHWDSSGSAMRSPTVSNVINQMKGSVTKRIGFSLWQRSFHDHVIRNADDYGEIYSYIDTNPMKWDLDCFYVLREEAT